jgi:chromate transporter
MTPAGPTFREALRYWFRLGWVSFGGPTGQIAMMHRDLVDRMRWIPEDHFLQALNFCMLLPGPEAQQLATYVGWLLHGTKGGIAAGVLFVLPAVFILWGLSWVYAAFGAIPAVTALFYGLKPAVAAIVAEAVIRIAKKSLRNRALTALAALAFVGIFFLRVPFPAIVIAAGLIGYAGGRWWPSTFAVKPASAAAPAAAYAIADETGSRRASATWRHAAKVVAICLPLWFLPVLALGAWRGREDIFVHIGLLFSKAAVVTFGGAYAVLAYIGQQAVGHYGWLEPEQMMDGLGLAETTPGPLIMVTQFVGYLASYRHADGLAPALAGAIGGLLTTWVTFVPCFMWIFAFAPFIERVRKNARLGAALSAVTAAVVGVVFNLFVIFTRHMLFPEVGPHFDWYALAAAAVAFLGMQRWRWGMIPVIVGSALAGGAWQWLGSW